MQTDKRRASEGVSSCLTGRTKSWAFWKVETARRSQWAQSKRKTLMNCERELIYWSVSTSNYLGKQSSSEHVIWQTRDLGREAQLPYAPTNRRLSNSCRRLAASLTGHPGNDFDISTRRKTAVSNRSMMAVSCGDQLDALKIRFSQHETAWHGT
jgi:hypothetical protein